MLGALPTEPILNAQLASLVGGGAGGRREIAGDLGPHEGDRERKLNHCIVPVEGGTGLFPPPKKGRYRISTSICEIWQKMAKKEKGADEGCRFIKL